MQKQLIVRHSLTYGRHLYVPVNEEARNLLAFVTPKGIKRKSFTTEQLEKAKELGYTVEILPMEPTSENT